MQVNISVDTTAHVAYGAPQFLTLTYSFAELSDGALGLNTTVTWRNKTSTRLAESLWWSFDPHPQVGAGHLRLVVLVNERSDAPSG